MEHASACWLKWENIERKFLLADYPSAVVLNSDSPTLPTALLVETANVLGQPGERAVLGLCTDGGYYLLGLMTVYPVQRSALRPAQKSRS